MQTAAIASPPGLADYIQFLQVHDWAYEQTEDHRVFQAGCIQRAALNSMRDALDPEGAVWNQYAPSDYRFVKPAPKPAPMRPPVDPVCITVQDVPFWVAAVGGFVVMAKVNGGWFDATYALGAALLNDVQRAYDASQQAEVAA